nr:hypothetical protein BaRGS_023879 [Batillaria attramentaria]
MTGPYGVLCLIAMATLFFGSCNAMDSSYNIPENKRFSGGSMSFEFVEAKRLQIIANTHDPVIFGNWSTERKRSVTSHAEFQDITDTVTQNIQGRVASVSTRLNFEQEIAHFDLDIDKGYSYMDV